MFLLIFSVLFVFVSSTLLVHQDYCNGNHDNLDLYAFKRLVSDYHSLNYSDLIQLCLGSCRGDQSKEH